MKTKEEIKLYKQQWRQQNLDRVRAHDRDRINTKSREIKSWDHVGLFIAVCCGSRTVNIDGYFVIIYKGYHIREHRAMYCIYHNCTLAQIDKYIVHHKNGNRQDNTESNLELLDRGIHTRNHNKLRTNPDLTGWKRVK